MHTYAYNTNHVYRKFHEKNGGSLIFFSSCLCKKCAAGGIPWVMKLTPTRTLALSL